MISKPGFKEIDERNLIECLNDFVPDIVGFSVLMFGKDTFHYSAQIVKEWDKHNNLISIVVCLIDSMIL